MKLINAVFIITNLAFAGAAQAGHPSNYHKEFRGQVVAGHSYYSHPHQRDQHFGKHYKQRDKHYKHRDKRHARNHHTHVYYEQAPRYYQRHVHTRYCDHRRRGHDTGIRIFLGL
ncbi:hypothetical protein IMCC21906_02365 [Spongiibacter sp. IMCC21906]|uniref:hypothetical protein n=1 Tax=Spongiibacter sp. IMCC21906 TaxID=1620392 RepID=UPI00062DF94F|nr:hypothetical protein [Spongiibacter sp. IMCC21906]AKH70025.1 hypothetical protein IMCC21906_02365 [Spongiibacter sp. IMCC21906]